MSQLNLYRVWTDNANNRVYFAENMEQVVNEIDESETIDQIQKVSDDARILGWDNEQELVDGEPNKETAGD